MHYEQVTREQLAQITGSIPMVEEPAPQGTTDSLIKFLCPIPDYTRPDAVQTVAELVTNATMEQGVSAFGWCTVRQRWIYEAWW